MCEKLRPERGDPHGISALTAGTCWTDRARAATSAVAGLRANSIAPRRPLHFFMQAPSPPTKSRVPSTTCLATPQHVPISVRAPQHAGQALTLRSPSVGQTFLSATSIVGQTFLSATSIPKAGRQECLPYGRSLRPFDYRRAPVKITGPHPILTEILQRSASWRFKQAIKSTR